MAVSYNYDHNVFPCMFSDYDILDKNVYQTKTCASKIGYNSVTYIVYT